MMFIIGHDACHGSLTPSSKINTWLARLAFLPSLASARGLGVLAQYAAPRLDEPARKDPVYCPMSLDEFQSLSPMRQRLERLCRSWPGMLPLYLLKVWWPLEINPKGEHRRRVDKRRTFVFDRRFVGAFVVAQLAVLISLNMIDVRAGAITMLEAAARTMLWSR